MSRGMGVTQRELWRMIYQHGKPMTFAEMRAVYLDGDPNLDLRPSFERSARHALQRMVATGLLITHGRGGRAEPHRYFIDPMILVLGSNDDEKTKAMLEALDADLLGAQ